MVVQPCDDTIVYPVWIAFILAVLANARQTALLMREARLWWALRKAQRRRRKPPNL